MMPSGDMKAVKVPVSKDMLESHLRGELCRKIRTMVTIIIAEAQVSFCSSVAYNLYMILAVSVFKFTNPINAAILLAIAYEFFIFLMQFPRVGGSDSQQYVVAVRLSPNPSLPNDALVHQQSARTCGRRANQLFPSDLELVQWNEIFFFKVDSLVLDDFSSPEFLINVWLCWHE